MRGVAARLGVGTMSPYRYVHDKDELVLFMADAAFGELGYPAPVPPGWRAQLEVAGRTLWSLFRRHPWLAQLNPVSRPWPVPSLAVHAKVGLAALDDVGLDVTSMLTCTHCGTCSCTVWLSTRSGRPRPRRPASAELDGYAAAGARRARRFWSVSDVLASDHDACSGWVRPDLISF
jgi:AcrR family transcriptional regulator